jgi:hypothetical protein
MSNMTEYLQYRALTAKYNTHHTINRAVESELPGKQVCSTLSHELVSRMENILALLGMTKRQLIEMAIINALDEAEEIIECLEVIESHDWSGSDEK